MDYLKIGKATELEGSDRKLYRILEIFPGFLSWGTLIILVILSYFQPLFVSCFIIAFDVYWLFLVLYLGVMLVSSYIKIKENIKVNWEKKCLDLKKEEIKIKSISSWKEIIHIVILPTYNESYEVVYTTIEALAKDSYPKDKMIIVYATEARGGEEAQDVAQKIKEKFGGVFKNFLVTIHPDGIEGEIKGKGSNQAWAAKILKEELIDKENLDYDKILVNVFDIDTVIIPGYFHCLTHKFLTVENPYRASYQPIPVYNNNIWNAHFFARVAASSNTFWQMMQQIRQEKLATYSSHSMTWRALVDIGFWSTKMVSEDSRIFWHCFCFYRGDYRVEPLYFPVSMDVCMDETFWQTAKNLYKQQRRWGYGVENLPYLIFYTIKEWPRLPKGKMINRIFVQLHGFHSWATNAIIVGAIGWLPGLIGGNQYNSLVISGNLPSVSRTLMTLAMSGMFLSAIISTLLLPPRPPRYNIFKNIFMFFQWLILPFSIIVFGAIPGLEAQTRLMFGKYMGFFITPKKR